MDWWLLFHTSRRACEMGCNNMDVGLIRYISASHAISVALQIFEFGRLSANVGPALERHWLVKQRFIDTPRVSSGMVEHEATCLMAIWSRSGQIKAKGNPLMRMLALAIVGSVAAAPAMAQSAAVDVGVRADGTGGAGGNASSGQATIGTVSNTTSIQGPSGGAYTIRNTPGLGQAIAIAPCVVGVGAQGVGPGFGFGVSFGKEDYACTVRGNAALLAQLGYTQEALTYFAQEVPQIARAFATAQQGRAATSQLTAAEAVAAPSYCRPLPYESVGDRLMREKNCRDIVGAAAEVGRRNRALVGGQHRPAAVQLQRLANREARRALRGGRGTSHKSTSGKSA